MLTLLYIVALTCAFFWMGLVWGKGYRPSRRSLSFTMPSGGHLLRAPGPPRRTERINIAVPILVTGTDAQGEAFEESTRTVTISGYGAAILLKRQVKSNEEINIKRMDKSREAMVRVLHTLARSPDGQVYGVAFVDPTADLWGACQLLTEAKQASENLKSEQ